MVKEGVVIKFEYILVKKSGPIGRRIVEICLSVLNVTINGVEHLLVLEQVPTGQYEEVSLDRVQSPDLGCVDPVIFLG